MANIGKYAIGIRLMLLREYLQTNASRERVVRRGELEAYLKERGYPVEKKTIYADLAVLGTMFGMQLDYDPHKKGYYLLNPPFEPYELRLLVDCVQAATFITEKEADTITKKIFPMAAAGEKERLVRPAVVKDRIHKVKESVVRKADIIHEAMIENRQISFRYFRYIPDRGDHKEYIKAEDGSDYFRVSPKELVWDNGVYYLERYRHDDYWQPHFIVERMSHIHIEPERRILVEKPKYETINKESSKFYDMMMGTPQTITIRFRNSCAKAVLEAFGEDTYLIPIDQHYFKIVVKERCNTEFYSALAQFGCYAKILAPQTAVEGFTEFVEDFDWLYKKDVEPLYMLDPDEIDDRLKPIPE